MLIVSPSADSAISDERIASGIDTAMMTVLRQLPRKMRIMSAVRQAAMIASRTTPSMAARTNSDWSASGVILRLGGTCGLTISSLSRMPWTMSRVEASPVLMTESSEARCPSTRTMFVCGGKPSRTCATSWM